MAPNDSPTASSLEGLIDEMEKSVAFLKTDAEKKLSQVIAAHPEADEVDLLKHYEDEVRAALSGASVTTALFVAQRSFLQLRRGKTGYNRKHAGLG